MKCLQKNSRSGVRWIWIWTAATLVVTWTVGCGDGDAPAAKPEVARSLDTGTQVRVVEQQGRYAKVAIEDGEELFVLHERLQPLNQQEPKTGATHRLATGADAFAEVPAGRWQPPPRDISKILAERYRLNRLYLSHPSRNRVIAHDTQLEVVDPETGEPCFPAYECRNPGCPGRGAGEEPQLFILASKDPVPGAVHCRACLEQRETASETKEQFRQYLMWVRLYELPETIQRRKQLDEELQRWYSSRGRRP